METEETGKRTDVEKKKQPNLRGELHKRMQSIEHGPTTPKKEVKDRQRDQKGNGGGSKYELQEWVGCKKCYEKRIDVLGYPEW